MRGVLVRSKKGGLELPANFGKNRIEFYPVVNPSFAQEGETWDYELLPEKPCGYDRKGTLMFQVGVKVTKKVISTTKKVVNGVLMVTEKCGDHIVAEYPSQEPIKKKYCSRYCFPLKAGFDLITYQDGVQLRSERVDWADIPDDNQDKLDIMEDVWEEWGLFNSHKQVDTRIGNYSMVNGVWCKETYLHYMKKMIWVPCEPISIVKVLSIKFAEFDARGWYPERKLNNQEILEVAVHCQDNNVDLGNAYKVSACRLENSGAKKIATTNYGCCIAGASYTARVDRGNHTVSTFETAGGKRFTISGYEHSEKELNAMRPLFGSKEWCDDRDSDRDFDNIEMLKSITGL
jgi:hypothetical protein